MTVFRRLGALAVALFVLAGSVGPAFAVLPSEMLSDPKLEARAREISKDIRCLVCRNENIDDSNADLAHDLRVLVRDRLKAGDANAEVKQYLVDRYGEYVLLKPRFEAGNLILWLGGPALLIVGGITAALYIRRARPEAGARAAPLSAGEKARLEALMREDGA